MELRNLSWSILSLFGKFDFQYLPGIALYNEKEEIELKEEFDIGNPIKYKNLIFQLDENSESFKAPIISGLKNTKIIFLQDENQNIIKEKGFNQNNKIIDKKQYYILDNIDRKISIFDNLWKIIKNIKLPCDEIDFNCEALFSLSQLNSLTIQLMNYPRTEAATFHLLDINSGKFTQHFFFPYEMFDDTSTVSEKLTKFPNENKYIIPRYFYNNSELLIDNNLLILLDSSCWIIKLFGKTDSLFQNTKMSAFISRNIELAIDENENIYSLSSSSKNLYKYDKNGNYIKTIKLNFDSTCKINIKNYDAKLSKKDYNEYCLNNSNISKIIIENENIVIIYCNKKNINGKSFTQFYIDKFDKNGKKMNIEKEAIEFPLDFKPVFIAEKTIVIYDENKTEMIFYWYETII